MFERDRQTDNYSSVNAERETVLSEDTKFKGSLEFTHKLIINGSFEGNLNSKGTLLVGKNGQVKAEVKVGSIILEGKVWGNVFADDKIELRSSAELYGDIRANRLTICEGAIFIGKCDVNPNRKETKEPAQQTFQQAAQPQQQAQTQPLTDADKKKVFDPNNKPAEKPKEPIFGSGLKL